MGSSLMHQLSEIASNYAVQLSTGYNKSEKARAISSDRLLKSVAQFAEIDSLTQQHIGNIGANLANGELPRGYNDVVYYMKHTPAQVAEHRRASGDVGVNVPGRQRRVPKYLPPDDDGNTGLSQAKQSLEDFL